MNYSKTINYQISDLSALHRNELEKALSETGIHSGQIFILFELWKRDGLSQIELSKNLKLSAPTINRLVKGLSDSGFVTLERSDTDRRLVYVFLTVKGKNIENDVEDIWKKSETRITEHLTETEKLIFIQLLEKILLYFYNHKESD